MRGRQAGGNAGEGPVGGEGAVQIVGVGQGASPIEDDGIGARRAEGDSDDGQVVGKRDGVARLVNQETAAAIGHEQSRTKGRIGEAAGEGAGGAENGEGCSVGRRVAVD